MARVNLEEDYPQISQPVGSSKEVQDLEVPLRNVATCTVHSEGESGSMGCPVWKLCDRAYRGSRPQNEIMKTITKEGGIRVYHDACFNNIRREVQLDKSGGYAAVIGSEGDTYLSRGSVKRHPKRDPDCPDCIKGECNIWDDKTDIPQLCPEFPAAADHDELKKFAMIKEARERGHVVKTEKQAEQLLSKHDHENAKVIRRGSKKPEDQ